MSKLTTEELERLNAIGLEIVDIAIKGMEAIGQFDLQADIATRAAELHREAAGIYRAAARRSLQ